MRTTKKYASDLNIRISPEQLESFKKMCLELDRKQSDVLRVIIEGAIKKHQRQGKLL